MLAEIIISIFVLAVIVAIISGWIFKETKEDIAFLVFLISLLIIALYLLALGLAISEPLEILVNSTINWLQ